MRYFDADSGGLIRLDYQPQERAAEMKNKINTAWHIIPKNVNTEACTQCGVCEEECIEAKIIRAFGSSYFRRY